MFLCRIMGAFCEVKTLEHCMKIASMTVKIARVAWV